eukprot:gnl/TRDRNA2_/TRDRNA2_43490_c0_seq1.p1 gnl/TRDRNA2_/TRDRNA2_43490_c0~~gnl/TRDRNA2_/TRDRNA2_43490_c0_seq1.p1  ORF type:complete len:340 (+),score=53.93 gnl/TRDRNA2_/TRDRNA2_43490_c0_seq1:118-1020(+)
MSAPPWGSTDAKEAFDASVNWLSGIASTVASAVEDATASATAPSAAPAEEVDLLECLPPTEQQEMLFLRERAETRAVDTIPDDGLCRLRSWAESVEWPAAGGEPEQSATWGAVDPRWKRLGFQSADPRRDLRTGILALDNFVYFCCDSGLTDVQRVCAESAPNALDYPVAVASINLTQMLCWYLSIVQGPSPFGPGRGVGRLDDMMQLHAFARLCASTATTSKGQAFHELHSAALLRLHMAWRDIKAADATKNLSALEGALEEVLVVVDHVLRESPLGDITELRRIADAPDPCSASWTHL